jgi:hypothetical protein
MKINRRLPLTSYLTIALSLVIVSALMDTATAVRQDGPINSPIIVETEYMRHGSVAAVVGSNSLAFSNSTIGDSSEIDLSLLQILSAPQA